MQDLLLDNEGRSKYIYYKYTLLLKERLNVEKRIIAGLVSLPVAAVIALIAVFLMGNPIIPFMDVAYWSEIVSGPFYEIAQKIYIAVHVLLTFGLWALYRYLSDYKEAERFSFWGFMFIVWGICLTLPVLGILAYVNPYLAQFYLEGNTTIPDIINRIIIEDSLYLGIPAAIFYTTGTILMGIGLLKANTLPRIVSFVLMPYGLLLSLGLTVPTLLILAWLFLFASSFSITYYRFIVSENEEENDEDEEYIM